MGDLAPLSAPVGPDDREATARLGFRGSPHDDPLRVAIDTIPGLVWSALPNGYVDFLNQRWCDYTGVTMEEAVGWGWQPAVFPEDLPQLLKVWNGLIATGEPGEVEARLRRHDGVYRWFLFRAVPFHGGDGTLVKWYGQTTDIEDRKRAEALLAGEKRVLEMVAAGDPLSRILDALCRLVEETAPGCLCGVVLVDPSGVRLEHGAAPSLPASYNAAIHGRPVNLDSGPCAMAAFLQEQVIAADVSSEARWEADRWCPLALAHGLQACWSTPIMSSQGRVLGTFALYWRQPGGPTATHQHIIEQMTHVAAVAIERGRTEEALQESEQRLRLMADAIPEVIWLTALHPETVLYASPSFERIWGLPLDDLYRNPRLWTETIHEVDRARVVDAFTRWIHGEGADEYDTEFRIVQPTGAVRWIHERGVVIHDRHGKPYRVSGISTDVTDRKRAEDELNAMRAELAHVARVATLGELTASIAHEVNQPLAGIVLNGNACLRWLGADPPNLEEAREAARRAIRDAQRAGEVIARLRSLFRRAGPAKESLDLNHVVQEVLALTRIELRKAGVVVRTALAEPLPPVRGDRVQLQQLVLNLVLNATEAMTDVRGRAKELAIGTTAGADGVRVSVRDSGVGLEAAALDRMFDAFYTTKSGGMGMGLAISRSIVDDHGGRIAAAANRDVGATFWFALPTDA